MTVVVSDTSVLCYLALIDQLSLLERLFTQVVIPQGVLDECRDAGAPPTLRSALTPLPRFMRVVWMDALLPETALLDRGESEAISLAWEHRQECLLLIDEKRGRAVAAALALPMRGVLGLIAEAHRRGWLVFDEAYARLRGHGFRLSPKLLEQTRQVLGLDGSE
jgi:predicted nucleic acid-binding protein